ncbi:putative U3 small nucleolar RNA-associated protein 11 [Sesamum angolense]|uniref:U3 small nucleolar RNA-associated protein 11 n=1 Tax=Sesamum angolense TaxID=2727404 RepID=A0AAE1X4S9_9LAMI|nr:putative U3 small nucleolar RNA-associated protein 11 [Sesamum angolense]
MSSLRNAVPRKAHKERAQPHSRRKFGLLEKHKDYVERARAYHKKEQALQKLKEKAAFRNPDEFYFKMIKTKTVNGVHRLESEANKYTKEELMLMKTQDIGYILQKLQAEKKKIEKLSGMLHCLDNNSSGNHVYFAEDSSIGMRPVPEFGILMSLVTWSWFATNWDCGSVNILLIIMRLHCWSDWNQGLCPGLVVIHIEHSANILLRCSLLDVNNCGIVLRWDEAREIRAKVSENRESLTFEDLPKDVKRKTAASYRELEARKSRVKELEKIYMDMAMQKELQKKGRKRKLREDEIVSPTSRPVYKWRQERKR